MDRSVMISLRSGETERFFIRLFLRPGRRAIKGSGLRKVSILGWRCCGLNANRRDRSRALRATAETAMWWGPFRGAPA